MRSYRETEEYQVLQRILGNRVRWWKEMSQRGDRCGVLGCYTQPLVAKCPICECYYCRGHWHFHYHPELPIKVQKGDRIFDFRRKL